MKNKNKKKLDNLFYNFLKVSIIISLSSFIFFIIFIFVIIFISFFYNSNFKVSNLFYIPLWLTFIFGIIMMLIQIFYPFDKNFNPDKNIPHRYLCDYKDYKSLLKYLNQRLEEYNYVREKELKIDNNELNIYINKKNPILLDFIVIFRSEEYMKGIWNTIDKKIDEFYKEYNSLSKIKTKCITLLIVDKKNSEFDKYCEDGYIWDKYNDLLHVGITLKGKRIYISNINEFLLKKRCRKIQKQVLDILEISEKDKI